MVFNLLVFLFGVTLVSATTDNRPWSDGTISAEQVPREIQDIGITENLGAQIDLGLQFTDEMGNLVSLQKYFDGKRPMLMSLVYYACPMLCNLHLNGVVDVFKKSELKLGKDFDMVVVSIDPNETPDLARTKKDTYIKELGQPEAANGWHFLTGSKENIQKLSQTVGFKFKWDEPTQQWTHTSAMYAITPKGVISRYLFGISFLPKDLKLALVEASDGKIGNVIDKLLLYCFQYDPDRRTYAFYAFNAMKLGGILTLLIMGAFLAPFWIRQKRDNQTTKGDAT